MPSPRDDPAPIVILAGVVAALHVGKLAPAIPAVQAALGMSLLQAGFLLSLVQAAGMVGGLALGAAADGLGPRRSMVLGLALLAGASALGGGATTVGALLLWRAVEGLGFLLVVLPAPGLVRQLAAPQRQSAMLGVWGGYMPLATALALLLGPPCIAALGWRAWWWGLAALSAAMAGLLWHALPSSPPALPGAAALPLRERLRTTLARPGPWWLALAFGAYSAQWLAVIGFLPAICLRAGVPEGLIGALTALVAAANIGGNLAAGRWLQRGAAPGRLLRAGFAVMALAAVAAFAGDPGLPPWARYAALLAFSGVGGLVPATLFALALRVAPGPQTVAATMGWMQQGSALGQFIGPPAVAGVAGLAGGWQFTGLATGACALLGLAAAAALLRHLPR